MNVAKLTVLMPAYNKEKYIAQAIDSVLMQKTHFEFELIIIDDKSTDKSLEIAQKYQADHPKKIRVLTNPHNEGCLSTTLKAYALTKTDYFCVLDPDDYWISEKKLQKAIDFLEAHEDFTIYMSNTYLDENNKRTPYFTLIKNATFDFEHLSEFIYGHTSGVVFRNRFFKTGVPKEWYAHIGTPKERYYEGDTFRNFIHLSKGKAYCVNDIESVYRITQDGIWTRCNQFQKDSINAGFFLEMFSYFGQIHPDFFLSQKGLYYIKRNLKLLDDTQHQPHNQISLDDLSNFCKIFSDYLKYQSTAPSTGKTLSSTFLFYMPSRIVGGYEFLFMRLATFLADEMGCAVQYIDYPDGFVKNQLSNTNTNVAFLNHADNHTSLDLKKPVNLIVPITMLFEAPTLINPDSKSIFWYAHPLSLKWLGYRSGLPQKHVNHCLADLAASDSVCFMDWACWDSSKTTSRVTFKENYLPVFTTEKNCTPADSNIAIINKTEINIGWLGRLDSDKIFSLINVLDNFYRLESDKKKNIHIIGNGESKHLIDVKKYADKINLIFTSTLIHDELYAYLVKNIDVLFSMGISTLEAASLKIPSVLTFLSETSMDTDNFVWIFNTKKYTLGYYQAQLKRAGVQTNSFSQIIEEIYSNNKKRPLGLESYDYFRKSHHIETVAIKLISVILKANLSVSLKRSLYLKILSTLYSTTPGRWVLRILKFGRAVLRRYL
ncbi:MAG TPA: glycosyltransferase [Gammaproteobacteria bacterium]|nr:glycosyltransferase [Gammaproteobacteria bacterium]